MFAARAAKPKLSLSISAATTNTASLALKSPAALSIPRTPLSPRSPAAYATHNSRLSQACYSTYSNSCSSKSILKKSQSSSRGLADKRIRFNAEPEIHPISAIENPEEYYGSSASSTSMSKEDRRERRWSRAAAGYSDDTSVAIVEKRGPQTSDVSCSTTTPRGNATIHYLENITADSREYRGIHPLISLESHQANLSNLVDKALRHLPSTTGSIPKEPTALRQYVSRTIQLSPVREEEGDTITKVKPDFISVTRGPGMGSNLSVGLELAKGLSVAWQIPIVGVHHMQAHLLTPRLASALDAASGVGSDTAYNPKPEFPFISALVSGGHSFLVHSKSLTDHETLASTVDMAIGSVLDKFARMALPQSYLDQSKTTMYGKQLEAYAFPNGFADYADYKPPTSRGQETKPIENAKYGWSLTLPYPESRTMALTFAGLLSAATRQIDIMSNGKVKQRKKTKEEMDNLNLDFLPHEGRVAFSRDFMRVCFEHLASRIVLALENASSNEVNQAENGRLKATSPVKTVVVSGGVAANRYLQHILRSFLDVRGFSHIDIVAPPLYLCTDNAAMIGWAGIEMLEAGWKTDRKSMFIRKWGLDPAAEDGGILGPGGWVRTVQ
ncbi:glycoprotease family protein [Arthroderma uncinatum]|uniref:glycoprotease family protein n=1 Tax=Arthroderma uncinatum TaxID=74035 RepID=UPI00144A8EBB|nr:glycoprotease family protein [Arthroderma uncinatum]KAF3484057.1 glycoprotease family protein [Arthroderma uncinatum]